MQWGGGVIGDLAVCYLFLAGAGAGALAAAVVLELLTPRDARCALIDSQPGAILVCPARPCRAPRSPRVSLGRSTGPRAGVYPLRASVIPRERLRPFLGPAYGVGLAAVLLGMFCLLADLGRPDRLLALFLAPSLSYIAVGAYLLAALVLCAAPLVGLWTFGASRLPAWLVAVARFGCLAAAVAVMAYTGLFLASLPAVPFWHSPWLPVLFVASSASAGLALVAAAVVLGPSPEAFSITLRRILRVDALLVAAESAVLAALLAEALVTDGVGWESATSLLAGRLALAFWPIAVLLGLAVPLLADLLIRDAAPRPALAVSVCILAGGLALRWCVIQAGVSPDIAASVAVALGMG